MLLSYAREVKLKSSKEHYVAPGLGFAFGLTGDDFVKKSYDRGWLMSSDSVATPANTIPTI